MHLAGAGEFQGGDDFFCRQAFGVDERVDADGAQVFGVFRFQVFAVVYARDGAFGA